MAIIKKNEIRPERPVVIVLYGSPGSGKTSVATTAENPVVIDADRGSDRAVQCVDTLIANTWEDIDTSIPDMAGYKTIIGDTAKAILDDFLSVYVCNRNYKLKSNSLKRFGEMADEFKAFVSKLQSYGSDIVFICHDKETAEGDVIKHSPDCTGSSKDLLLRKADQVGYISLVNGKRTISFDPRDNFIGKNVAQIPAMEIPDASTAEFSTFMADIIKRVKTSICSRTEAQRKANEMLAELREELAKVSDDEGAATLLNKCGNLPDIMKRPFFMEINKALTAKGFTYTDKKFTLSVEADKQATDDADKKAKKNGK